MTPGNTSLYRRFVDAIAAADLPTGPGDGAIVTKLGWMPAEAWQYNSALEIGRLFVMRVRFAGVVPMIGHDTYLREQLADHAAMPATGRPHARGVANAGAADPAAIPDVIAFLAADPVRTD